MKQPEGKNSFDLIVRSAKHIRAEVDKMKSEGLSSEREINQYWIPDSFEYTENGPFKSRFTAQSLEETTWRGITRELAEKFKRAELNETLRSSLSDSYNAEGILAFDEFILDTTHRALKAELDDEKINYLASIMLKYLEKKAIPIWGRVFLTGVILAEDAFVVTPRAVLRKPNKREMMPEIHPFSPRMSFDIRAPDSVLEVRVEALHVNDLQREIDSIVRSMQLVLRPSIHTTEIHRDSDAPTWMMKGTLFPAPSQYIDSEKSKLTSAMQCEIDLIGRLIEILRETEVGMHEHKANNVPWQAFMRFLYSAQRHYRDDDRVLSLVMAIDALLGEESKVIGSKLSARVARIAEAIGEDPHRTIALMNLAYKIRSKISHELKVPDNVRAQVTGIAGGEQQLILYLRRVIRTLLVIQFTGICGRKQLCKLSDDAMISQKAGEDLKEKLKSTPECVRHWT